MLNLCHTPQIWGALITPWVAYINGLNQPLFFQFAAIPVRDLLPSRSPGTASFSAAHSSSFWTVAPGNSQLQPGPPSPDRQGKKNKKQSQCHESEISVIHDSRLKL